MQLKQLQRIRLLQNRMRRPNKSVVQEQSLRSIKSTDSKKVFLNRSINGLQRAKSDQSKQQQSQEVIRLDTEIKNNRKITDYFNVKPLANVSVTSSAKIQGNNQQIDKKQIKIQRLSELDKGIENFPNENKSPNSKEEMQAEQIKCLKQKIKLKDQVFVNFRNKVKKQMLQLIIKNHKMKINQMRLRVNHNKIRLGEYHIQKKGADFWIDGSQIREIKEKLQSIMRQKQELQRSKKSTAKRISKQYTQDPQQLKNALTSQSYFLSRQQGHLQEILKRLEQQKSLHMKQLKLLYDQQNSKYGKVDHQTGITAWPKIGKYQLLGLLGKGGFSEVYKGYDTQNLVQVACKLHQLNPHWNTQVKQNFIKHALRQQEVHKMLDHPNIVKLHGTVQIDQNAFCTVLQFCQGPDLSYYLKKHKRLPQKQAKMIIKQVINAIRYLHQLPQKVIHYDLKPQNIMFHKGRAKITDFGLCKKTNQELIQLTSQGVGTYWYLPPQCFITQYKPQINSKVDIWSIGVIYFEMLFGQKPFGNQMSQMRILNEGIMLKANSVNFPISSKCVVSNESKQFIKACLKANVEERLDIKGVLSHPLFDKK